MLINECKNSRFLILFVAIFLTIFIYSEFQSTEQKLEDKIEVLWMRQNGFPFIEPETIQMRRVALQNARADRIALKEAARIGDTLKFYEKVKMEAHCENMQRIGGGGDGGKFVCNPGAVKDNCTLLSLGLNNQINYDEQIFKATSGKCVILGADKDVQRAETQRKYENINGQLFSGLIPDELSIPSMLRESGRSDVELLKIDIEGGEVTGLEPLLRDYYVCQIFIELHKSTETQFSMLQMMAKYRFRLFSIEPNPRCRDCCEYSLINEKCMEQFGAVPLAITIPLS